MNCSTYQKNIDSFYSGKLPEDMKNRIQGHLFSCKECAAAYSAYILTDRVVEDEVSIQSNPFLATRIMAEIEETGLVTKTWKVQTALNRFLQPVLVTLSMTAAIVTGIVVGNLYLASGQVKQVPEEFVYLDDASIESLNLFIVDNND